MISVGILAIQGGFLEHETAFKRCMISEEFKQKNITLKIVEVRRADDLTPGMNGLVIPGGESTTMARLLKKDGFGERLKDFIKGTPSSGDVPAVWGTCSGLIMLANDIHNQKTGGQYHIGGIDVTVSRNFFGRQINSFEAPVVLNGRVFTEEDCHGVFIRAPAVVSCDKPEVVTLGSIDIPEISAQPVVVAVQQNNLIATAFHPELTEDLMWHKHFLKMCVGEKV